MPQVAGSGVPVLIHQPFELVGVCVPRPNVFGLEMLKLAVNVVSVPHDILLKQTETSVRLVRS